MTIAHAHWARTALGSLAVLVTIALFAACGSSDVTTTHEGGGGMPTVPQAGSGNVDSGAPVTWCAAYHVINCVCQQCHQNPPIHNAPVPLMTYDDTQAPLSASSSTQVWTIMQSYVMSGYMPFRDDKTVMPPVQPLSAEDKNTLLSWFAQGATDLGGQDCAMTCDWSKGPPSQ